MNVVQYIFANRGLGMSPGKMAAQVAHGAVLSAAWSAVHRPLHYAQWMDSGHYPKLVMDARATEHLLSIDRYLVDRGIATFMVIDEGRTEIPAHTPTALAAELIDKDLPIVAGYFSEFDLFPAPKRWPKYA